MGLSRLFALALALSGCAMAQEAPAPSSAPAAPPMVVQDLPPSDAGYRIEVVALDIPPGRKIPWHTHPGTEIVRMIEGEVEVWRDGMPDKRLTAGEFLKLERGLVHGGRNPTDRPARAVITYIVDAGQPQRIPADPPR